MGRAFLLGCVLLLVLAAAAAASAADQSSDIRPPSPSPVATRRAATSHRRARRGRALVQHGGHRHLHRDEPGRDRRGHLRAGGRRIAHLTPVPWFRPPYGSQNADTRRVAGSLGFVHLVLWDVDPGDWRGYGASTIAANTLSHVHSGAIVGLHLCAATMYALPTIMRGLRARGYRSVSLPELFHAAGRR